MQSFRILQRFQLMKFLAAKKLTFTSSSPCLLHLRCARLTRSFDPIGTTNGICVALLVAVKQLIPEHEIGVNGVNMSANYLPVVYATVVFVFTALQFVRIGVFVFTAAAFQCSWTYLRFYQRKDNARGDLSDSFAYATLFPDPVRRFVLVMANMSFAIFRPLLTAGLTQPQESQAAPQPTSKAASIDAERRRQRALKALDERLNATANDEEQGEGQV